MNIKKSGAKSSKTTKASKITDILGDIKFTPLQLVRLEVDAAIAVRRDKDKERLKKVLALYPFDSIETFQLLSTASKNSGNDLAGELASPAMATIEAISQMGVRAHAVATHAKRKDWQKAATRVTEQVDFALALILRVLTPTVRALARHTKNPDLLCETLHILIGNGHEAASLVERYEQLFPEHCKNEDGAIEPESYPDLFAWDTYLRVAALEKMVDTLPKHIATAARQMNAWPMLRYCHSDRKKKFDEIIKMLELGADYPLDVGKHPAWRPDTPMIQYLDRLVCRLNIFRSLYSTRKKWETKDVKNAERIFIEPGEKEMSAEAIEALRDGFSSIEKLTRDSAELWAIRAIVPYIMVTDAKTSTSCSEPALKAIWKQKGVNNSRAKFESRLTPLVVRTLTSMARP